jgi:hypothetical protein
MAYSTTEQVNRILGPHAVTASTPVTTSDVDALRTDVSYRIDAVLAGESVSTVPATDGTVVDYLAAVESWGVAAQVLKALFPEATGPGEQPAHAYWEGLFKDALKSLPKLIQGWANADLITLLNTDARKASSYFTENTEEEAELGDLEGASLFKTDPLGEHPW